MSLDRVLPSYDNQTGYKHSENVGYCICFLALDWLYSWVPCVVVNDATISSTSMLENVTTHDHGIGCDHKGNCCFFLCGFVLQTGWAGQNKPLICSVMPGQNHLFLALWIDLSTYPLLDGLGAAFGVNTLASSAVPRSFRSSK